MKVLLYGGCHALVLRDLFHHLIEPAAVEVSLLINFQLIAAGQPFPYELLDWCDVFIYSPIENKGEYNTDLLLERCQADRPQVICFPWLEWHGYCPGAVKGIFKGRFQWFYPGLIELAAQFDRFEPFADEVLAHFPPDDLIDRTFIDSSEKLAASERRRNMSLQISDFIGANFRTSRLFLISDHPSLILYLHVLRQICDLLGLRAVREPPLAEPQWRWRTPIFPRVAHRLGLEFCDPEWVDDELIPDHVLRLESYLSLYFHRDSVILGPIGEATISFGPGDSTFVGQETRILANRLPGNERAGLDEYVCLEALCRAGIALERDARFLIDGTRWRSTWNF